ncbi:MAG: insulinase family protein, partial [Methanobrevibacter sp.]|nr:insulinase family protein [Methanobrevibacter sp.]
EFENEKKIVMQELLDSYEDPNDGHYTNLIYNYFDVHDPTGIPADIDAFTYEQILQTAKDFYTKPLRIIEVGKTRSDFSNIEFLDTMPEPVTLKFKDRKQEIMPVANSEKVNVFVFSKLPVIKTEYPNAFIGMQMLCDGLNSPFCQEIREKRGLSYYVMGDIHLVTKNGILVMNACTDEEHAQELVDLFKDMCKNVTKYLTRERYEIIINQIKTMFRMKKCLRWKNVGDLINMEMPNLEEWINDGKIQYERVVGVIQKYFYEMEIITK